MSKLRCKDIKKQNRKLKEDSSYTYVIYIMSTYVENCSYFSTNNFYGPAYLVALSQLSLKNIYRKLSQEETILQTKVAKLFRNFHHKNLLDIIDIVLHLLKRNK